MTPANPFNELDAMLFSRVAYLPFSEISLEPGDTLRTAAEKMTDLPPESFKLPEDQTMIFAAGDSARYGSVPVSDYQMNNVPEQEEQFSAVTLHMGPEELVVSYCGTDGTLVGWKEDFNMAYMENVPAQESACRYLTEIAGRYPNRAIRIVGHSKGGNLAIYAACRAAEPVQRRLRTVTSFDGPGFKEDFFSKYGLAETHEKAHTFIPQDSVIGRLLEHGEAFDVIESDGRTGLEQHNLYLWRAGKDYILRSVGTRGTSDVSDDALSCFVRNTSEDQRKFFVEKTFSFLMDSDQTTLSGAMAALPRRIPELLNFLSGLSEKDRKTANELTKEIIRDYLNSIRAVGGDRIAPKRSRQEEPNG